MLSHFEITAIAVICHLLNALSFSATDRNFKVVREKAFAVEGKVQSSDLKLFPTLTTKGRIFVQPLTFPEAKTVRFHFVVVQPSTHWCIRVVDHRGKETWTKSADDAESDFWSEDIEVDDSRMELWSTIPQNPVQITIPEILADEYKFIPQAITPPDNRKAITGQSKEIKEWGRAVARLKFVGDDKQGYYCTGFLVSSHLLITNYHCVHSNEEMKSALVTFDYDGKSPPTQTRFVELITSDYTLDFALLRIRDVAARPHLDLLNQSNLPNKYQLLIIEHAAGGTKQISKIDCVVAGSHVPGLSDSDSQTDFGHRCDTLGGSSGSPVLDFQNGKVVGLHHLGFEGNDSTLVNQGVYMGKILEKIKDIVLADTDSPTFVSEHAKSNH